MNTIRRQTLHSTHRVPGSANLKSRRPGETALTPKTRRASEYHPKGSKNSNIGKPKAGHTTTKRTGVSRNANENLQNLVVEYLATTDFVEEIQSTDLRDPPVYDHSPWNDTNHQDLMFSVVAHLASMTGIDVQLDHGMTEWNELNLQTIFGHEGKQKGYLKTAKVPQYNNRARAGAHLAWSHFLNDLVRVTKGLRSGDAPLKYEDIVDDPQPLEDWEEEEDTYQRIAGHIKRHISAPHRAAPSVAEIDDDVRADVLAEYRTGLGDAPGESRIDEPVDDFLDTDKLLTMEVDAELHVIEDTATGLTADIEAANMQAAAHDADAEAMAPEGRDALQEAIVEKQAELAGYSKRIDASKITNTKARVKRADTDLAAAQRRKDQMEEQHSQVRAAMDELDAQRHTVLLESEGAETLAEAETVCSEQHREAQQRAAALQAALDTALTKIAHAEQELQDAESSFDRLNCQLDAAQEADNALRLERQTEQEDAASDAEYRKQQATQHREQLQRSRDEGMRADAALADCRRCAASQDAAQKEDMVALEQKYGAFVQYARDTVDHVTAAVQRYIVEYRDTVHSIQEGAASLEQTNTRKMELLKEFRDLAANVPV